MALTKSIDPGVYKFRPLAINRAAVLKQAEAVLGPYYEQFKQETIGDETLPKSYLNRGINVVIGKNGSFYLEFTKFIAPDVMKESDYTNDNW